MRRALSDGERCTAPRVLDFSRIFAGPAATQVLGDLGADVIKVEEPARGDEALSRRGRRTNYRSSAASAPRSFALNRNKRSITLDLRLARRPQGRAGNRREMRRGGAQLPPRRDGQVSGIGYEHIKAVNPGVIFGEFTPTASWADRRTSAPTISGCRPKQPDGHDRRAGPSAGAHRHRGDRPARVLRSSRPFSPRCSIANAPAKAVWSRPRC